MRSRCVQKTDHVGWRQRWPIVVSSPCIDGNGGGGRNIYGVVFCITNDRVHSDVSNSHCTDASFQRRHSRSASIHTVFDVFIVSQRLLCCVHCICSHHIEKQSQSLSRVKAVCHTSNHNPRGTF